MYHSVSSTINELTEDTKHLGAKVGYICVLHTLGSEMNYHPHIHVILLGGGLTAKNQWKDKGEEFFLPVKVLSKLFRGKYMDELKTLWEDNKLEVIRIIIECIFQLNTCKGGGIGICITISI